MSSEVVVWEWEETPNLWVPYDSEVCHFIEGQYRSLDDQGLRLGCHTCLNLGHVHHNLMFYEVDLINFCQTRVETGRIRRIKRSVYPTSWPPGQGVMWQWWNDVTWVFYDILTCHLLEKAICNKDLSLDLSDTPLNIPVIVEIGSNPMKQVNMITKFKRPVQRIVCSSYPCNVQSNITTAVRGAHGLNYVLPSTSTSRHNESDTNSSAGAATSDVSAALPLRNGHKATSSKLKTKRKKASHITKDETDSLSAFCSNVNKPPDEDCSICFEKLSNDPGFESTDVTFTHKVKKLNRCDHMFHSTCLHSMYESGNKDGSLQCPTCKTIHGIKKGNQPVNGTMSVRRSRDHLPGHPDCGMIVITYDFRPGVQGSEHPQPGKRFTARGFPRVCYIPDNVKGNKVLKLLQIAWDRRLIFAVGSSSTTGEQGTVVWNEIHHKTEPYSNQSGHGYPDPNHLDNMLAELAAHGVSDEDM